MSQEVQVILFLKGKGSDGASFRPRRDETQWWNRRDALVRCVAAFLFGTQHANNNNTGSKHDYVMKKSLVLLFDEDWARIHLELVANLERQQPQPDDDEYIPMEKNIIQLLKRAAEAAPGTSVRDKALQATLIRSPHMLLAAKNNNQTDSLPSSLDSKRAILEYLQNSCSMEFLRKNGLNSSTAAVLKKTNKKMLTAVWRTWVEEQQLQAITSQNTAESASSSSLDTTTKQSLLPILVDILKPNDDPSRNTVAGILHESGDAELPVWGQSRRISLNDAQHHRIVLFLGAVRDMTRIENDCLGQVCRQKTIPLVKIRLGKVPEFTSKILSVVAFHAARGMLLPAIQQLLASSSIAASRKRNWSSGDDDTLLHQEQQPTQPSHLKVICFVPIHSKQLVTDLDNRSRVLWSIVRCAVVTLWRSKIHGKEGDSPLLNELFLVFQDGLTLSLQQEELVSDLAEQHQAAPCEFQILSALQKRVQHLNDIAVDHAASVDWSKHAKQLVKQIRKESPDPYRAVSVTSGCNHVNDGERDLGGCFYAALDEAPSRATYILLQTLGQPSTASKAFDSAFRKALAKKKCQVIDGSFADACDDPALPIAMTQHFAYQGRLGKLFT